MKKIMIVAAWLLGMCLQAQENETPEKWEKYFNAQNEKAVYAAGLEEWQVAAIMAEGQRQEADSCRLPLQIRYKMAAGKSVRDTTLIYKMFRKQIDEQLEKGIKSNFQLLQNQYKLKDEELEYVKNFIMMKQRLLVFNDFRYAYDKIKCREKEKEIKEIFDRRVKIELLVIGVEMWASRFCEPLVYKSQLKLSGKQIRDLAVKACDITDRKNAKENANLQREAACGMQEILTPLQYTVFLKLKVKDSVSEKTEKMWNEMKAMNLDLELDSAATCRQLFNYYTEVAALNERYRFIPEKKEQKADELAALKKLRPSVIKKYNNHKRLSKKNKQNDEDMLMW